MVTDAMDLNPDPGHGVIQATSTVEGRVWIHGPRAATVFVGVCVSWCHQGHADARGLDHVGAQGLYCLRGHDDLGVMHCHLGSW